MLNISSRSLDKSIKSCLTKKHYWRSYGVSCPAPQTKTARQLNILKVLCRQARKRFLGKWSNKVKGYNSRVLQEGINAFHRWTKYSEKRGILLVEPSDIVGRSWTKKAWKVRRNWNRRKIRIKVWRARKKERKKKMHVSIYWTRGSAGSSISGIKTLSIMWMTPFVFIISVLMMVASFT